MPDILKHAELHPEVAHLSIAQLQELHTRYLAGERLPVLFAEYGVQSTRNSLQVLLPLKYLETQCPACGDPLQQRWKTKTGGESAAFCKPCNHVETQSCSCKVCHARRISAYNGIWATTAIPYDRLSLRDKILLLALVWSEEHVEASIGAFGRAGQFSNSRYGCARYIAQLRKSGVIKLVRTERWKSDIKDAVRYMLETTKWSANVAVDERHLAPMPTKQLFEQLRSDLDTEIGIDDEETLVTMIRENAEDEAFQYAEDQLYRQNLDMTAEAKSRDVLRSLIETTPLESVLAASWEAVKSVKRAFEEKVAKNRKHASNMFPNTVQRKATARATKSDAWVVNRNPEQVSRLTRILHDRIFGGDDAFFGWPLPRYYAEVIMPRLVSGTKSPPQKKLYSAPVMDRPRAASEIMPSAFPWLVTGTRHGDYPAGSRDNLATLGTSLPDDVISDSEDPDS